MRTTTIFRLAAALTLGALPGLARAQSCPVNPAGGPSELVLTSEASGSDIDVGYSGQVHNLPVPAGSELRLCLSGCDASTDPVCSADGGMVTVVGQRLGPPIPLVPGGTPICLALTFTTAPNGTANVQTGAIDLSATLRGTVYLSSAAKICPRCSGATVGAAGTCDSGARSGLACVTDDIVTVPNPPGGGNPVYEVSRDCQPSGFSLGSVTLALSGTTGTASLSGAPPCPNQPHADGCSGTCTGACSAAANRGGVTQSCCSDDSSLPCFPNPITRTGSVSAPLPAWPDTTYPKTGSEELVGVFCAPSTGNGTVDGTAGLPGPIAIILPVAHDWLSTPTPPSSTTTTSPGTTTSTSAPHASTTTLPPRGCTSAADCADGDPCTEDQCNAGLCSNPPIAGIDGAQCALGQLTAAALCPGETIHPKLLPTITKKLAKAGVLLGKAKTATGAKRAKLLRKARASLQAILNKAAKFGSKGKISAACAESIRQAITGALQTIPSG